jgi:hypothetical protein
MQEEQEEREGGMDESDRSHSTRACGHLEAANKKGSGPILQVFEKNDTSLFSWVEWIVKDLLPRRFCKKPTTRKFSLLDTILVEN